MGLERDIYNPSWMRLEGTFDEQVETLFRHVRVRKGEIEEELRCLLNDVAKTLGELWPDCDFKPFGSLCQGTGLRTSDADYLVITQEEKLKTTKELALAASDIISRHPNLFAKMVTLIKGPIPHIQCIHVPTGRECDLFFDCPEGLKTCQLMSYLLGLDKRALDLAGLVKYWAKVHRFSGPNLMRHYALTAMVIFYLQHLQMMPPVQKLQQNVVPVFWDVWNVAFEESTYTNDNQWSLKELLGGFFTFYSAYKFEENIISIFVGRSVKRECFKAVTDVPTEFELYKVNRAAGLCKPLQLDTPICVQDDFEHSWNCTRHVKPELAEKIIDAIKMAAKMYESEPEEGFLRAILKIKSDI